MNIISTLGFIAAFLTTASFLPQAIKTIQTKNTSGISLIMYSMFSLGTLTWLVYGIFSNNLPIVFANGITFLFAIVVLVYKIKYR